MQRDNLKFNIYFLGVLCRPVNLPKMAHWGGGGSMYLQKYVFFMEMKKQNIGENVSLLQHHVAVYCILKIKYLL